MSTFTAPVTGETSPGDEAAPFKISPTDVSQFIRLEQCRRYLRLRLHERAYGRDFFEQYGVHPQTIPPLLTRSGQSFEDRVEVQVAAVYPARNLAKEGHSRRDSDNDTVVAAARALSAGSNLMLFQIRLSLPLGEWWFRGDIDILRMERSSEGVLHLLIVDMKSSAEAKMEHRLQVAFYHQMLSSLLAESGVDDAEIDLGILFCGSVIDAEDLTTQESAVLEEQRAAAERLFGVEDALLQIEADPKPYIDSVHDLVTGADSLAMRTITAPFEEVPYHLTHKCDGCLYNEFCMKWTAEHSDLSLVPHLTVIEKEALKRKGISSVFDLAHLKDMRYSLGPRPGGRHFEGLVPATNKGDLTRALSGQWGIGHRLDELILRARRYLNWKQYPVDGIPYIPSKGHGSLPYSAPDHNHNLVKVYIDAQHDYLQDRLYLIGSLVVANENGVEKAERRAVVRMTDGPPDTPEKEGELLVEWIEDTLRAVVELAAQDENGEPVAPIHLIFFNRYEQRVLLDALARHLPTILAATPMYDFLTQKAAFDSPIATFLDDEIRDLKNYPMLCQSLQAVSAFLKFNWREPENYRTIFRERMFDFWGKLDGPPLPATSWNGTASGNGKSTGGTHVEDGQDTQAWYTNRARFKSEIPLEYAYAAWGELATPPNGQADSFEPYRKATTDLILNFQVRRLQAIAHIVDQDFRGNHLTTKTPFRLPDLALFAEKATTLAHALEEFVTIERHVTLAGWKAARNIAPERRVLMGETLLVRYYEEDQYPGVAEKNRDDERRRALREDYRAAFRTSNPAAKQVKLTPDQKAACDFTQVGTRYRLRIETAGTEAGLDEVLGLSNLREGDTVIIFPRITYDSRLPIEQRTPQTPTPKQMLYGPQVRIERILVDRDAGGRAERAFVEVEWQEQLGGEWSQGFVFRSGPEDRPLAGGQVYTLDPDINDFYGYWCRVVTTELCKAVDAGNPEVHALYSRLIASDSGAQTCQQGEQSKEGQARFYRGLEALHLAGEMPEFEESKHDYIARHGDDPVLLVQGPPGTGKSYSTAFAIFARLQGAMAEEREFRVFISCKTHAATDVLLENVRHVQSRLRYFRDAFSDLYREYFDSRLPDIDLFRVAPKQPVSGVTNLPKERDKEKGEACNADCVLRARWCVVASTPGHIYQMVKTKWSNKSLFGHYFCDLLVLDEASQMNIPEALMAALPLKPAAQLIVVGDHRQMAPIVKHSWDTEPRRTFKKYRTYRSLFVTLMEQNPRPPIIRFAESFRLHSCMAEFLRQEIYSKDGIRYHSNRHEVLPHEALSNPFVAAVLSPEHPLVVIVHGEMGSQTRNEFEQRLIGPVLEALADPSLYGLDAREGMGVVVPHRAQRAAMQTAYPYLSEIDARTGAVLLSAIDTVERFQGGERQVVLYSATESDRDYLLAAGKFLYDPNRLTVAISRAKRKMILVASQSIFSLFSPDEAVFANAQLWKDLLRRTCTVLLWEGQREGRKLQVWGNLSREPKHVDVIP